jgi:hypothetical protein
MFLSRKIVLIVYVSSGTSTSWTKFHHTGHWDGFLGLPFRIHQKIILGFNRISNVCNMKLYVDEIRAQVIIRLIIFALILPY